MSESIEIDNDGGKRPRMMNTENNGDDFLSNLPECIIGHILSFLPTKDVLRTCVLSKDWEYKWTSIYNVDINDGIRFLLKNTRKTSVVRFVDRIFILSRNSTLKRFHLLCQQKYDARRIMTWLTAALMRNVEDMEVFYNYEGVVLPRCLFNCTTLTMLKLKLPCTFRPVKSWFANLKILCLAKVEILNEHAPDTMQLMFNFPVLETFKVEECKWLKVNFVEINAPALTKFNVEHHSDLLEENCQIKIRGAKLEKFEFYGHFLGDFDLIESSVFCAYIDYHGYSQDLEGTRKNGLHARLLLKGCSGLNHLKLSGDTVKAIVQARQGPPLPKLDMLKQLEIFMESRSEAFLEFLHVTPSLERIRVDMWLLNDYDYDLVESIPSCIVSRLKEVHFDGFTGEREHVHLADFLLKNAVELTKMYGLSRKRSEERKVEKNFWARLKRTFRCNDFEVGPLVKTMADFERVFG